MTTNTIPWYATKYGAPLYLAIRLLAVVDAVAIPAAVMWWFYLQPKHGGMAGSIAAVFMGYWALKRGFRAVRFDGYDWMAWKIGRTLGVIVLIWFVMKGWSGLGWALW